MPEEGTITREDIKSKFEGAVGFTLIDVRDRVDFDKEHIMRSMCLPVNEIEARGGDFFYEKELLIVYSEDSESTKIGEAASILRKMGFNNILEFRGGLKDWKEAGFVTEGDQYGV